MHSIQTSLRVALLASAFTALVASAGAQTTLYSEDFNNVSNTTLGSFGWTEFRGGSPSTPSLNSSGASTAAPFNPERGIFMNINTTSATTSWFAGMRHDVVGALPTNDLSQLSLTANIYGGGSVGAIGDVTFRIESSANNWLGFTVTGASLTADNGQLVGGLLSSATASLGTFDLEAASYRLVLVYGNATIAGSTVTTWGNDSSNILGIDNVTFSTIPEPSTYALGFGALALTGAATARRRRNP